MLIAKKVVVVGEVIDDHVLATLVSDESIW